MGLPDCEWIEPENGAFIRIFAWASGEANFLARTQEAMTFYKIHVLEITNVESVQDGKAYGEEPELLSEFLEQTVATKSVVLGTFNLYPFDDGRKQ